MKAITLWQPWASLVALGVKTIETRSWSTSYRGQLFIHAAAREPDWEEIEDGHRFGTLGDFQWARRIKRGSTLEYYVNGDGPHQLPLGVIVAVCDLVAVVPILGVGQVINARPPALPPFVVDTSNLGGALCLATPESMPAGVNIEDQRAFGDFTPGRYAWLLENIRPLELIEATGHQKLWDYKACDECFAWCERAGGVLVCTGAPDFVEATS